jgi:ubiquinone/menaquinone biosynthesis C-methylase UbiE
MCRTDMEFTGERVVPGKTPQTIYDEHIYRYVFAASLAENKVVLDVACGTGYGAGYMADKGADKVVGVDISLEAVDYARERHSKNNKASFVCADAIRLPFADGAFDIVVSFETIEHIRQYRKFLAECRRVLKENGLLICSTPNRRIFSPKLAKPMNIFHVKEFWPEEFYRLLHRYFADIVLYGQCDVKLSDNSVDRTNYSVHEFNDNNLVSSAYVIAVARKQDKGSK